MVWIQLLAYFVVCTLGLMGVLEIFAWLLRRIARLPRPLPLLLGLLLYGVLAGAFALPLFGLELVEPTGGELIRSVGLFGYLLALLLAVLYFKRRHFEALRSLGYFQGRPHG